MGFQNSATAIMEGIVDLHSDMLFVLISVCFFVTFMMVSIVYKFHSEAHPKFNSSTHHTLLEVV
jgi:heme/copper-type cytochrome/quinol oxidase subunit 2